MKRLSLSLSIFISSTLLASPPSARYATVTQTTATSSQIDIAEGETGELISYLATTPNVVHVYVLKADVRLDALPASPGSGVGTMVKGPASFLVQSQGGNNPTLMTVRITPETADVNKTLIIPPGTNQFYVTMETSTNLVQWMDATNGIFGSPDVARFFRIRMDKQN